jgi:hypothetical protein
MPTPKSPDQLELDLPSHSWTDGSHIVAKSGTRLRRWGSVKQACTILDDCDRQTIYDLWHSGQVTGYKRNPAASNSHLRIDLLSVWDVKQRQLRRA